jgi:hypothetical protein
VPRSSESEIRARRKVRTKVKDLVECGGLRIRCVKFFPIYPRQRRKVCLPGGESERRVRESDEAECALSTSPNGL